MTDTGVQRHKHDPFVEWMHQLERLEGTPKFSWSELPPDVEIQSLQDWPGAETPDAPSPGWIFDHVPKTGGMHFSRLCASQLQSLDHLYVRWPGSWNGVTLGRVFRARIVHG